MPRKVQLDTYETSAFIKDNILPGKQVGRGEKYIHVVLEGLNRISCLVYNNAKSCLKKDNMISDYFICNIGVRQGDNYLHYSFHCF